MLASRDTEICFVELQSDRISEIMIIFIKFVWHIHYALCNCESMDHQELTKLKFLYSTNVLPKDDF